MYSGESVAPSKEQLLKYEKLKEYLKKVDSVAVAFSGGVDSAFLLMAAREALSNRAAAVTVASAFFPERETRETEVFCEKYGISRYVCRIDILEKKDIANNPKNRCYLCKKVMFENILEIAKENDLSCVAEGSNLDDNNDYRPGLKAVAELGIKSPLRECGMTKQDIRTLSEYMELSTWNKPSLACLASRFAYGEMITAEKLEMTDRAEKLLFDMDFSQVRVRVHGVMARIEVMPQDFGRIMEESCRNKIVTGLKSIGFTYVSLDMSGYRTGSMNEETALISK